MRPLYGPSAPWRDAYPVHVETIAEREGQLLRKSLLSLFSPYGDHKKNLYDLKVTLNITKDEVGLRRDETAQRARIHTNATYTLKDLATKKVLLTRTQNLTTSYAIGDRSSTAMLPLIVEEKDAKAKLMEEMAHTIHMDVVIFLQEQAQNVHSARP